MAKFLEFVELFKQYGFEWIIRAPRQYTKVLVCEFYVAYNGELMRQYLPGMLWKPVDPIPSLMIHRFWVDI